MNRVPLVLLTGFLGSGKTTLLNGLLATPEFRQTAVLINEAGDTAIDHLLVEQSSESVVLLDGGCMCCRAKGSLAPALADLWRRTRDQNLPPFRRVVVETSGLSDPAVELEGLIADVFFNRNFALSGVVTVVDVRAFAASVKAHPEARMQVALADRLLLTKTDLATPRDLAEVQAVLSEINPQAAQLIVPAGTATMASFWPDSLDLPRAMAMAPELTPAPQLPISTASASFAGAIDPDALEAWLDHTVNLLGPMLLRMKAMLDIEGASGPTVLHVVQGLLHRPVDIESWPNADHSNRIVLIGRDIEQQLLHDAIARLQRTLPRQSRRAS